MKLDVFDGLKLVYFFFAQVYPLFPLFLKFGGGISECLKRWLDAEEVLENEHFEPLQCSPDSSIQLQVHSE